MDFPTGGFLRRSFVGISVAKASAPKVSMMRFTHSSWTAVRGTLPEETAATKLMMRAATLTTHRPHRRTVTTEAKLSSRITMSELSFATSVPCIPMESPISASLRAGASFVPSPVTATTCPFSFRHWTIRSLSNGEDLAITLIFSTFAILSSGEKFLNWIPSTTDAPSEVPSG
ncbi:hypothetical protein Tsubulata_007089 [Turnera subulata]|uniref:Uncharacterized protein n=1 Tax=Turnera subulata TaxID=218843 RepID=A0A9Q0JEF9_9ROSI|nr:hypothetical protein Tsubulata_007089 [Turnera subulata]